MVKKIINDFNAMRNFHILTYLTGTKFGLVVERPSLMLNYLGLITQSIHLIFIIPLFLLIQILASPFIKTHSAVTIVSFHGIK